VELPLQAMLQLVELPYAVMAAVRFRPAADSSSSSSSSNRGRSRSSSSSNKGKAEHKDQLYSDDMVLLAIEAVHMLTLERSFNTRSSGRR
jgi:hypothetical protein